MEAIIQLNKEMEELSKNLSKTIPEFKAAQQNTRTRTEIEQFILYTIKTYGSSNRPYTKPAQHLFQTPDKVSLSSIDQVYEKSSRTFLKAGSLLKKPSTKEHTPHKLDLRISPRLDAKAKLFHVSPKKY